MSELVSLGSILLSVVGALLGAISAYVSARTKGGPRIRMPDASPAAEEAPPGHPIQWTVVQLSPGQTVLLTFAVIVVTFGVFTIWRYWHVLRVYEGTLHYVAWLFIAMIAGMFVQVVSANYRRGGGLFDVTVTDLVYPLLFALVVFYPVWAIAASAPRNLFSFYAAFLNGFFWETVVASAKLPATADQRAGSGTRQGAG